MGFLDSVKNSAQKAKLKGEIALIDREINQLQSSFGVELFDKLTHSQPHHPSSSSKSASSSSGLPSLSQLPTLHLEDFMPNNANQKAIHEPLEACRADVMAKQKQIDAKRLEIEKLQCNRERFRGGTFEKIKHDTASHSEEAKLQVQIKLLEREIQQRKELLGRTVFDLLVGTGETLGHDSSERSTGSSCGAGGSRRGGVGGGILGKLKPENKTQKELATLVDRAQRTAAVARQKKMTAEREIAALEST